MENSVRYIIYLSLFLFYSCLPAKTNIFFAGTESINTESFQQAYQEAEKNYIIAPFDYIAVSVFTNKGEVLVDPNFEFQTGDLDLNMGRFFGSQNNQNRNNLNQNNLNNLNNLNNQINRHFFSLNDIPISRNRGIPISYRVDENGFCRLPMIGLIKLEGYTLQQADSILIERYKVHYEEPFVVTQYTNKRVIIMGAWGNKTFPLRNESMSLLEILANAGEQITEGRYPRTDNIKVIRNYLGGDISVQVLDLSTLDGLSKANLHIYPNDIIYIEPRRQFERDNFQIIQIFTSAVSALSTLYLLIERVTRNDD